jgi:hypothetical protein
LAEPLKNQCPIVNQRRRTPARPAQAGAREIDRGAADLSGGGDVVRCGASIGAEQDDFHPSMNAIFIP